MKIICHKSKDKTNGTKVFQSYHFPRRWETDDICEIDLDKLHLNMCSRCEFGFQKETSQGIFYYCSLN